MLIVIAWVEKITVWDGEDYRRDLGRSPNLVEKNVAKSCTWLHDGDIVDYRQAKEYAEKEFSDKGMAFLYSASRQKQVDPYRDAEQSILKIVEEDQKLVKCASNSAVRKPRS